jgi:hypothetical protein
VRKEAAIGGFFGPVDQCLGAPTQSLCLDEESLRTHVLSSLGSPPDFSVRLPPSHFPYGEVETTEHQPRLTAESALGRPQAVPFFTQQTKREMDMKIYVGNLAYSMTEADLKGMFAEFGEIVSAELIKDRFSGQSKGFGFVEMPNNSEADIAIKALNGKSLNGRNLKVNQAQPRSSRAPRRSRY